jgi:hypothetical protein
MSEQPARGYPVHLRTVVTTTTLTSSRCIRRFGSPTLLAASMLPSPLCLRFLSRRATWLSTETHQDPAHWLMDPTLAAYGYRHFPESPRRGLLKSLSFGKFRSQHCSAGRLQPRSLAYTGKRTLPSSYPAEIIPCMAIPTRMLILVGSSTSRSFQPGILLRRQPQPHPSVPRLDPVL